MADQADPQLIPVEDWMQTPVVDSGDYLDRDVPLYLREEETSGPTKAPQP